MENFETSKLKMFKATDAKLVQGNVFLSGLANYPVLHSAFTNYINLITQLAVQQNIDLKGLTKEKEMSKDLLFNLSSDSSNHLTSFAKFTKNNQLYNEISFSQSKLKYATDEDLLLNAQLIYDRTQTNLTNLAIYGSTAATQTALLAAITSFSTIINKQVNTAATSKQITKQIKNAFKDADDALKSIDLLVNSIKKTQPIFVEEYWNVRKVVVSKSALSLKILVVDQTTNQPIQNATATITLVQPEGGLKALATSKTYVKKTAKKGGANIKLPDGIYNVAIEKIGFPMEYKQVTINNNKVVNLEIQLTPFDSEAPKIQSIA